MPDARPCPDGHQPWCTDHDNERGVCATSSRYRFIDVGPSAAAVKTVAVHLTAETDKDPAIQVSFNGGGDAEFDLDAAEVFAHAILIAVGTARGDSAL